MACVTVNMSFAFKTLPLTSSSSSSTTRVSSHSSLRSPLLNTNSLKLGWSINISASITLPQKLSTVAPPKLRTLTVVSAKKGYKMKTHKASAKRFRVTGAGKIVRRRAGKQHLLYKKNSRRKLRLSKMNPDCKMRGSFDMLAIWSLFSGLLLVLLGSVIWLVKYVYPKFLMHPVSKSDYNNVIGALPYLKVNRKGNRSLLCKTEQAELEAGQQE